MIITAVTGFCRGFWARLTDSRLWAIIMAIYLACSRSWQNSRIMRFLKGGNDTAERSRFARWLYAPFDLLSIIAKKTNERLSRAVEQSVICELGRLYVHNFMALNTRFWGTMLLVGTVTFNTLHFMRGMGINKYVLILSGISALMLIFNFNVTGFFNGSRAADFVKACAGVRDITFDFFDEKRTTGRARFISAVVIGLITGAVMIIKPLYGVMVPFAAFGMLLVLEYPITGVYAAVFIAPLIPFSSMPLAGICIWTLIAVVIRSLTDKDFTWKKEGVGAALIAFLLVLLVSCIFSFSQKSSMIAWMMYLVFISFYFAVINTIKTRAQLFGLLRLFVISGALVALYGVMQYIFGWTTTNAWIDEEMFEEDTMRVFSTLANPNVLGEYLLLVLPVSAVFFLKDSVRTLSKWVYLGITGLVFICLILTQSRGCWLGFMVSVAIFVTFYEGRWWALIPLALCVIPFVIPQTIVERLSSVGNMEDSSTSYRVYIWMGAMGILRHYLAGGIGMGEGAFGEVYPFFSYNAIIAPHSHNTFLQLLVEGGIPALATFIAIMVVTFRSAQKTIKAEPDKKAPAPAMVLGICAGLCGFLFQSLFDYTFYNYRVMAVFFMLIAIVISFRYVNKEAE